MPSLVYYDLSTGLIQGVWTAVLEEHLTPNMDANNQTHGYLLVDDDTLTAAVLQERYWVQNGALTPATEVTLVATPNPFQADGVAECRVQPQPFLACTLLVGPLGQQTAVDLTTAADPLILTADTPQGFRIALAPIPGMYAAVVMVEAV
jgi:hypothetical protein